MSHYGFGVEPGSAAKASEDAAKESGATQQGQFRGSMGIRMTRSVGQKFQPPEPASSPAARETAAAQAPKAASPAPGTPGALQSLLGGLLRLIGRR